MACHKSGRGNQSNPGEDHWTAVKNILKYLKRTKDMFLVYGGDKELPVFILNGGAVSWCSSKQSVVAGSMCEAEYIAASETTNEGVHIRSWCNT